MSLGAAWTFFFFFFFFLENKDVASICTQRLLTPQDIKVFSYAVAHDYWFQYFIDDLPIWGKKRLLPWAIVILLHLSQGLQERQADVMIAL